MKSKTLITKDFPYLGLEAYQEKHKDFFYGRLHEVEEVFKLINKHVITILFAKSGLGKTSLLQAGLVPELRKNYYLPISLTLDFNKSALSPLSQCRSIITKEIQKVDEQAQAFDAQTTLWEYFHQVSVMNGFVKPVLIFDQFEQMFIAGKNNKAQVNEFISEIAALVENQMPESAQERYADQSLPFDRDHQNFRVIFSLREDYLPQLENLNAFIPSIKKSRFRLSHMNRKAAIEAVFKAGEKIISDKLYAGKLVDLILSHTVPEFSNQQNQTDEIWDDYQIEPFLLSLVCFNVNQLRVQEYANTITDEILNKVDIARIIKNFYYQSTYDLNSEIKNTIETGLLTHDGYRKLQHKSDLLMGAGISEDDINKLIDRKIIRNEIWNGGEHLELIHDILVPVIKESRDKRIEQERQRKREEEMREIRRQEEAKRLAERKRLEEEQAQYRLRQQQKIKFMRAIFISISVGLLLALAFATYAFYQKNIAEKNARRATSNMVASAALIEMEVDPTRAFRLAERAYLTDSSSLAARIALLKAFYMGNFYSLVYRDSSEMIKTIEFSPKGDRFLAAKGTEAVLYNLKGEELQRFTGHSDIIHSACFSPDGRYVLTASEDTSARLWDINGNEIQSYRGHKDGLLYATFSPDGEYLVTCGKDNRAFVWNFDGKQQFELYRNTNDVSYAEYSLDGQYILTFGKDYRTNIWTATDGELLHAFELFREKPSHACFTPKGDVLVACIDSVMRLYTKEGRLCDTIFEDMNGTANYITFSPSGEYLLTANNSHELTLWNTTGRLLKTFKGHNGVVLYADYAPDGKSFMSTSTDNSIRRWQLTSIESDVFMRMEASVDYVELSPNEKELVTVSDSTIILWTLNREKKASFKGHSDYVYTAKFSSDGQKLLTASEDGTVKLWNMKGDTLRTFEMPNRSRAFSANFSPDGQKIVTTSYGSVIIWSLDGNKLVDIDVGELAAYNAVFSPDGQYLAACVNYNIGLWNIQGDKIHDFKGHTSEVFSVNFSPDGLHLVSASVDKTARVWDVDGDKVNVLKYHKDKVFWAAYSPDGRYIVTAGNDKAVNLWDAQGNRIFTYTKHHDGVFHARFTNDGNYILSGSRDGTLRMWPVAPAEIFNLINKTKVYGDVFRLPPEESKMD